LQNSSSQSGSGGNVDLNPATVGIPVIAYLIGAAIFLGAVFLLYRRAVNKKKDILSK
jgi:nitrate reductase gamma subunit